MRVRLIVFACLALLVCAMAPVVAQDLDSPDYVVVPGATGATCGAPPVIVQAREIDAKDGVIRASGNVLFLNCNRRINASSISFDTLTSMGTLRDVTFTTCDKKLPDYRFTAKELKVFGNNRISARGVSLYLGRYKVITLPALSMRLGGVRATTDVFPRPGYDKNDGASIAQTLRLSDDDRLRCIANIKITQKNGIEGSITDLYAIDGALGDLPGRFLSYESLRSSVLNVPRTVYGTACAASCNPPRIARLRQFGSFTLRQRTYNVRNTGLAVYRQPEVGLHYVVPQLNFTHYELDPRLYIYPEITGMWGRYRETDSNVGFTTRQSVNVVAAVNFLPLGRLTAIQPVFCYSNSGYGDGLSYQTTSWAIDATHVFTNGSMVSGRYIKRGQQGVSPFQFDTIDIFEEFQSAFQARIGQNILGFVMGYNLQTGSTYDYEVLLGHQTDCLIGWVSWHQRVQRLMFNVSLVNS